MMRYAVVRRMSVKTFRCTTSGLSESGVRTFHRSIASFLRLTTSLRVVAFYQSLGLTFTEEQHGKGPLHYSAPLGDGIIEIYPLRPTTKPLMPPPDSVSQSLIRILPLVVLNLLGGSVVIKPGRDTPWGYTSGIGCRSRWAHRRTVPCLIVNGVACLLGWTVFWCFRGRATWFLR